MSFGEIKIKSGHSIKELNVNSLSAITINFPTATTTDIGYVSIAAEVDAGSSIGIRTIRTINNSQDFRLPTNIEIPLFNDMFNHDNLNTSIYKITSSASTIELSGGTINLNANLTGVSGAFSNVQTFKTFPIYEVAPTYVNFRGKISRDFQPNNIIEFGLGLTASANTPTDGVFFRASGGTLYGVLNYNGTELITTISEVVESGTSYDFLLAINNDDVEFWIDDIIVGKIDKGLISGATTYSTSFPLFFRNYNAGSVALPISLQISLVDVLQGDLKTNKPWGSTMVSMGNSSIKLSDGSSGTTSANIINNTPPQINVLSNTDGGYTTLGGDFAFSAVTSAETEYIMFAYLNPSGSTTYPPKSLIITTANIYTFTSGATITGNSVNNLQWELGVGGTDLSLLTADSVTAGTRAARRIGLGVQRVLSGATDGTLLNSVLFNAIPPLMVEAGTYLHVILKVPNGTTVPNLVYRGNVIINGYYE